MLKGYNLHNHLCSRVPHIRRKFCPQGLGLYSKPYKAIYQKLSSHSSPSPRVSTCPYPDTRAPTEGTAHSSAQTVSCRLSWVSGVKANVTLTATSSNYKSVPRKLDWVVCLLFSPSNTPAPLSDQCRNQSAAFLFSCQCHFSLLSHSISVSSLAEGSWAQNANW